MRKIILILPLCFMSIFLVAQDFSVNQLLSLTEWPQSKADAFLSKKNYRFTTKEIAHDTILSVYQQVLAATKNRPVDSMVRSITRGTLKNETSVIYGTSSAGEFMVFKQQLVAAGFICHTADEPLNVTEGLFQHHDETVRIYSTVSDTLTSYFLEVRKQTFPKPQDIYYADDLLAFTSHEYLVHYFGEPNVKKDVYYFAGNDIAKCSVLFLNTDRQVVFIWQDEQNKRAIANLLFGGQQKLRSSMENDGYVGQSTWRFKSGVRAGMTLYELRQLHGADFQFYGGKSANSGAVIPDSTGKIDFKREDIILGCMNCRDDGFANSKIINADDALADGRILFVLSVILNPPSATETNATAAKPF